MSKDIKIKWPNDIFYVDNKIGGILIESKKIDSKIFLIIGIGINVNMKEYHNSEISQKWSSLYKATGKIIDRNNLIIEVLNTTITCLDKFEEYGFIYFMNKWKKYDLLKNRDISIKIGDKVARGKYQGINHQGQIEIIHNNETKVYSSGEVKINLE